MRSLQGEMGIASNWNGSPERFARPPDGTHIAFRRAGSGPPILLVHGGGGSSQDWYEPGYVDYLRREYSVIALDLRGHGASDKPTDPSEYAKDRMTADVLAVADACGEDRFTLWGMSYGSKICRYLALASDRVERMVLLGAEFGPGVTGQLRADAEVFCQHWPPVLAALDAGGIQPWELSGADRALMEKFDVRVMLGWVGAMLDWPAVLPEELSIPTLWVAGADDEKAVNSMREHRESIERSPVTTCILEELDHNTAFERVEITLPILLEFMAGGA